MFKFLWQRDKEMQSLAEIIAVDADSIELGKSAYVNGKKIEGTLTSKNEIKAVAKKNGTIIHTNNHSEL